MFRFAYPEYLWLLWLLPLLVAVWTAAGQLARRRLSRFGRLETIRPLMPDASTGRRRLKFILYLTAFALLTLALARPQLGSKLREVESRGIEMMLVVDVSNAPNTPSTSSSTDSSRIAWDWSSSRATP